MTSRERVTRAIEFRCPDRIPIHNYAFPGAINKHGDALVKVLKEFRDDFGNIEIENNINIARQESEGNQQEIIEYTDEWGTVWRRLKGYTSGEITKPALPTWDKWENYKPPQPMPKEVFQEFSRTVEKLHPEFYVYGHGGNLFHQLQFVRGTEGSLMDIAEDRREIHELADIIVNLRINNIKEYLSCGVDGIFFGDDLGTQTALFISPVMWRRFLKPRYKKMFDIVRDSGKHILFHSDGWIMEILDDFAELGVNVINPQHNIMGNEKVAEKIRGRMCLRSDLDRQYILPGGTPEKVMEHVKEVIDIFAKPEGGLILHGEIGPEIPIENIQAMYRAYGKYGGRS